MSAPAPLALVTGAAGAIGSGVCDLLTQRGYEIIAVDRDETLAEGAAARLDGAVGVANDAADPLAVAELCSRVREEWADRLEVVVANAGLVIPGEVAQATSEQIDTQLDVMLRAPAHLLAAAAQGMCRAGRGHLLATVSMGGILALPGSATYSAAKAGLRAYLSALSAEVKPHGVAVSGIYPSGVDTPMLRHEARNGGSMLNFVGTVYGVEDVVRSYAVALDSRRLEVYLPWSDSLLTRGAALRPQTMNRLIPLFERLGRRGHAKFLRRLEEEEALTGARRSFAASASR